MLVVPLAILVFNITAGVVNRSPWPLVGAGLLLLCAATGLHTSRRGKFLVWRDLLDQAAVDGTSRVLDIGCGRGAVLTLVAGHLTTGRAVGIDLWKGSDQSGNSALATRRNAEAEGVGQARRRLHGGHARAAVCRRHVRPDRLQHRHPQRPGP
jgi:ribosomal protein L11 methylase PrmA